MAAFYLNIFSSIIYSCDGKAKFSASLLQSVKWSFRYHSNMIKKHFLLLSMLKTCFIFFIFFVF